MMGSLIPSCPMRLRGSTTQTPPIMNRSFEVWNVCSIEAVCVSTFVDTPQADDEPLFHGHYVTRSQADDEPLVHGHYVTDLQVNMCVSTYVDTHTPLRECVCVYCVLCTVYCVLNVHTHTHT